MMKKILLLSTMIMATTVLAFGGGGSGRKAATYEPGLVAIGIHFGGTRGREQQQSAASECTPACTTGQECVGGACVTVTPNSSNGCSNNSDCEAGCASGKTCYCEISSSPNWNDSNCYTSFTGTCAEVETKSGISGGYVASNGTMSWWSAVNFCKAVNKKMVSLSDLGITGGYQSTGMCSSVECTGTTWSDVIKKIGFIWAWVKDASSCSDPEFYIDCTSDSNNNSCNAYAVFASDYSYVHGDVRTSNRSALCE